MAKRASTKAKETGPPPNPVQLGYARVSTDDQDERMQIDALLKAGVLRENIYQEKISGGAKFRPQYDLLMRDARAGDTVHAWKLDRLSRTAVGLYQMVEELRNKGAFLNIITVPGMDTRTPFGAALFGMLAVFAEFERAVARERTMAGLAAARARGKVGGRTSKLTDEDVLAWAPLGTKEAMRRSGLKSKSGWNKRLLAAQIRAEQKRMENADGSTPDAAGAANNAQSTEKEPENNG